MKTAFKTFDEIKNCVGIGNINNDLCTIEPYTKEAYCEIVEQVIGDAYYDELATKYDAGTLTPIEAETWNKVQCAMAHYGYVLYADTGNLSVDDTGIFRQEYDERKSGYQWQVRLFKDKYKKSAYQHLHKLALCLCDQAPAAWVADTERIAYEKTLIWKLRDFKAIRSLRSWHAYWVLCSYYDHVLNCEILPYLTTEKYDALTANLCDTSGYDPATKALLKCVREVMVFGSIIEASKFVYFSIEEDGLMVTSFGFTNNDHKYKSPMKEDQHAALIDAARQRLIVARHCIIKLCPPEEIVEPVEDTCGADTVKSGVTSFL